MDDRIVLDVCPLSDAYPGHIPADNGIEPHACEFAYFNIPDDVRRMRNEGRFRDYGFPGFEFSDHLIPRIGFLLLFYFLGDTVSPENEKLSSYFR